MDKARTKTMLPIPFYKDRGDGIRCAQVCMRSVLKYVLGKRFDLEYLDAITGRKPKGATNSIGVAVGLYELGLDVRLYSASPMDPWLGGADYAREKYGEDVVASFKDIDTAATRKIVMKAKEYALYEVVTQSFETLQSNVGKGYAQIALIDWHKLKNVEKPYQGHFVVVTGFDAEFVYFHNTGPAEAMANMRAEKSTFKAAWDAKGTDNDLVVIFGKRRSGTSQAW